MARVESSQLFIVHVQDGSIYEGTIRTPETPTKQPMKIEVLRPEEKPTPLRFANVVELAPTSELLWRRFSGNIDTGLIYTKGNDTTQYNAGADLRVRGEHWRVVAGYISTFSTGPERTRRHGTNPVSGRGG